MKSYKTVAVAVLGLWVGQATAGPSLFEGHYYELIMHPEGIDWNDAKSEAEGLTYLGAPGYLATITSADEDDFIMNNIIVPPTSPWVGGFQPPGSPEPDGGWEWITGEPWSFSAWSPGEPNNLGGDENALQKSSDLGWNDVNADTDLVCYVVEYVPEPLEVSADVKPGSWPNPLNPISKGVLPLAICGTEDFDVMTIDPATILLGDALAPIRWSYEDVATPADGDPCQGHDLNGDGFMDLTLKFGTQDLVSLLGLGDLGGQTVPLVLTGALMDGTLLTGSDCVWVLTRGDGNKDGLVDGLDYVAWANNYMTGTTWSEGDFNDDGVVDGLDYVAWASNYGAGYGPGAPIPEPATVSLLALGGLALLRRRSLRV